MKAEQVKSAGFLLYGVNYASFCHRSRSAEVQTRDRYYTFTLLYMYTSMDLTPFLCILLLWSISRVD